MTENIVYSGKDFTVDFTVEAMRPGFTIWRGRRIVHTTDSWQKAVAWITVEREAARAIKR